MHTPAPHTTTSAHRSDCNHYPTTPPFQLRDSHQDSNTLLALALLLDFLPHERAHQLHQRFASEVLYRLPQGRSPLFLSRHDIMSWVNAI
ncbi:DUF6166 domain-containing protein [Trichlorobacter sp.]|uniref:DUF6166 domain-containing protein n=1 Tax=Trichlorobacter sp. TaxID=2911007 RepID=UPI0039C99902